MLSLYRAWRWGRRRGGTRPICLYGCTSVSDMHMDDHSREVRFIHHSKMEVDAQVEEMANGIDIDLVTVHLPVPLYPAPPALADKHNQSQHECGLVPSCQARWRGYAGLSDAAYTSATYRSWARREFAQGLQGGASGLAIACP